MMFKQDTAIKAPNIKINQREQFITWGAWMVMACIFFVPINKPAVSIFMALALLLCLLGARLIERIQTALSHPIVLACLAWHGLALISVLYSPDRSASLKAWTGQIAWLYPLIVVALIEKNQLWRQRAWKTFAASMLIVIGISYLQWLGVIAQRQGMENPSSVSHNIPFKEYTQQGLAVLVFLAMLASWLLSSSSSAGSKMRRWYGLGIALGIGAIYVVTSSRTAWLVTPFLLLYWAVSGFSYLRVKRAWLMLVIAGLIAAGVGTLLVAQKKNQRLAQMSQEITARIDVIQPKTSMGTRIELWKNSIPIIQQAPWLGLGYDQWHSAYLKQTKDYPDYEFFRHRFPHQEQMLIWAEQGLVGLLVYFSLLIALLIYCKKLPAPYAIFHISVVLIYLIASLVNSLMPDFAHRHLFILMLAIVPFVPQKVKSNEP